MIRWCRPSDDRKLRQALIYAQKQAAFLQAEVQELRGALEANGAALAVAVRLADRVHGMFPPGWGSWRADAGRALEEAAAVLGRRPEEGS